MKRKVSERTVVIIGRDGKYITGTVLGGRTLKWSSSPYDAWSTRSVGIARIIAEQVDGDLYLFNPVVSQTKLLEKIVKGGLADDAVRNETSGADLRNGQPDHR